MTKLDLLQLAKEIRVMNRSHKLYKVLRDELGRLGHWKYKSRGNPAKGYQAMRGKIDKG